MEKKVLINLVTKAQAGDANAMNRLFEEFYEGIYMFIKKTLGDGREDAACDATQETFIEVFKTVDKLKEPAAFVSWMKRIAYHQCTRYFKKKKEILVTEDEDGNTLFDTIEDTDTGVVPQEVYEKEEFRTTIMDMVNALSEQQRSAVILYYFEEMSVGQIAEIQDVSEGTIKSRLNYARKSIKKAVEDYEKKHNIKLHSVAIAPLFLLGFKPVNIPQAGFLAARQAVATVAASSAKAASASGVATTVGTAGAKAAAGALTTKIIAVVVAVSLTIGGVIFAVTSSKKSGSETTNPSAVAESVADNNIAGVSNKAEGQANEGVAPKEPGSYESKKFFLVNPSEAMKTKFVKYLDSNYKYILGSDNKVYEYKDYPNDEYCLEVKNPDNIVRMGDGIGYKEEDGTWSFPSKSYEKKCSEPVRGEVVKVEEQYNDGKLTIISFDNGGLFYTNMRDGVVNIPINIYTSVYDSALGKSKEVELTHIDKIECTENVLCLETGGEAYYGFDCLYFDGDEAKLYVDYAGDSLEKNFDKIMDISRDTIVYSKKGQRDKLLYISDVGHHKEKEIALPEGYTVDDIVKIEHDDDVSGILFKDNKFYLGDSWGDYYVHEEVSELFAQGHILDFAISYKVILGEETKIVFLADDNYLYATKADAYLY